MKEIYVSEEYHNTRIDRFLLRHFPTWSAIWVFKILRLKKVLLNGKKCEPSTRLTRGDCIQIHQSAMAQWFSQENQLIIDENVLKKINGELDILYEDDNIVIIKKSPNIEAQTSLKGGLKNIQNYFLKYLWNKHQYDPTSGFVPSICNRLDRNTSGLIMAAKTLPAQQILQEIIKNREVDKLYWCLVGQKPFSSHFVLDDYLYNDKVKCKAFVSHTQQNEKSKRIITECSVLRSWNDLVLLGVKLITGRTHQIRAHCAFYGFPIVGDRKYGNGKFKELFPYQALHNYQIRFNLTNTNHLLGYLNQKIFTWNDAWFLKPPYWDGK